MMSVQLELTLSIEEREGYHAGVFLLHGCPFWQVLIPDRVMRQSKVGVDEWCARRLGGALGSLLSEREPGV